MVNLPMCQWADLVDDRQCDKHADTARMVHGKPIPLCFDHAQEWDKDHVTPR